MGARWGEAGDRLSQELVYHPGVMSDRVAPAPSSPADERAALPEQLDRAALAAALHR